MTLAFLIVFGLFLVALGALAIYVVRWGHREDRRRNANRRTTHS
ncbi:MAG: hypothetical protein ACYDGY_11035 [Acidimicrobiales bacterium]